MSILNYISGATTVPANAASQVLWSFGTATLHGNLPALMYQTVTLDLTATAPSTGTLRVIGAVKDFATIPTSPTMLLGTATLAAETAISIDLDMRGIAGLYRVPDWSGIFDLSLEWTGALDLVLLAAGTLTTTGDVPIESGTEGFETARSRVERCPICGTFMPREQMVKDGFRHGLKVCPECYDPPDPLERRRYPAERGERD